MAFRHWLAPLARAGFILVLGLGLPLFGGAATAAALPATVLVLGDSLSAEYGLVRGTGWVKLLDDRIKQERPDYSVENASISGETTAGGVSRLPALLARLHPGVVIIELGANDGLRGLPLETARSNLDTLVREAQAAHARVLVIGIQLPPNYGPDYTERFSAMFDDVARVHHTALVPRFLNDIGAERELFQADGLHPTAVAQPHLRDKVWEQLRPLLR